MAGDYVKLRRGSDWGVLYFYHPDRPKTASGTYGRESGISFREGDSIGVRWPDGETSIEKITSRLQTCEVGDMGRPYVVTTAIPGISFGARGIQMWVPIDDVEVLVEKGVE